MSKEIITREGLAALKIELKDLIEKQRPAVIADIKEAREQGDLSENAEFDAAREKQGQIEDRIKQIEEIIEKSKVVSTSRTRKGSKVVTVGSTVTIEELKTGNIFEYQIVGTLEADPFQNKISNVSPFGVAIIDKKVGETAIVLAQPKYEVKIKSIK